MKHFYVGAVLALVALAGCQPTLEPQGTLAEETKVVHGALYFKGLEEYDAFLVQPQNEREAFFAARSQEGFVSYADVALTEDFELVEGRAQEPLVNDHVFSRMLNEDGVIKIGPWYCRVNAPEEKVFVLHEDNYEGHYTDLVGQNTDYPSLLVFSTDTEVLEELKDLDGKANMAGRGELYCDGADANQATDNRQVEGTGVVHTHDTWLRYFRYGIGFALEHQVKWRYRTNNIIDKWRSIDAWNVYTVYQREYEVKCGAKPGREWNDIPLQTSRVYDSKSSYNWDIYRGSRKLSEYRARVQTYFRVPESELSSDYVDESTRSMYIQYP